MVTPTDLASSWYVQNDREFKRRLRGAVKQVGDLRWELGEIARDWFKSNRAQFTLKGYGQYTPLNPDYQERKDRLAGRRLPILVGAKKGGGESGRLRDSITGRPNKDSVLVITRQSLLIGTRVPYGVYHQSDRPRRKIPLRKFLFIGPEAPRSAPSEITGRLSRWLNILDAGVQRKLQAEGFNVS